MSPPINTPDGSEVSEIVLPDGSTASEVIGPDGNVVFEAGGDIPDSGLDHFYWSQELSSTDPWPDEEGSLAASSNGGPQLESNGINGNQSILLDGADDDYRTSSPPSLGSGDEYTAAGVFEIENESGNIQTVLEVGDGNSDGYGLLVRFDNNEYGIFHRNASNASGGSVDTNPHVYVISYDGDNLILDIDGSEVINASGISINTPSDALNIGSNGKAGQYVDGYIGAAGHEASAADSVRRDELTDKLADPFGISTST